MNNNLNYFRFMGAKVDNVNFNDAYRTIRENINKTGYVCLTDVGNVVRSTKDNKFMEAINNSLLSIADGTPLSWYGKLSGYKRVERISGLEIFSRMLNEKDNLKHFLLGDTEKTISKIINKAQRSNGDLQISGYSPPFRKEFSKIENQEIINKIKEKKADVIWVSLGGGKQDKWMHMNFQKLDRGVMVGVGGAFRFYIGEILAPPKIIQKLGLQWYTRLIQQPHIFKYHLKNFPVFIFNFPFEMMKERKRLINGRKSQKKLNAI